MSHHALFMHASCHLSYQVAGQVLFLLVPPLFIIELFKLRERYFSSSSFVRLATSLLCVYERKETNQWDPAGRENPCLSSTSFLGTFPPTLPQVIPPPHITRGARSPELRGKPGQTQTCTLNPPKSPPFLFGTQQTNERTPFYLTRVRCKPW